MGAPFFFSSCSSLGLLSLPFTVPFLILPLPPIHSYTHSTLSDHGHNGNPSSSLHSLLILLVSFMSRLVLHLYFKLTFAFFILHHIPLNRPRTSKRPRATDLTRLDSTLFLSTQPYSLPPLVSYNRHFLSSRSLLSILSPSSLSTTHSFDHPRTPLLSTYTNTHTHHPHQQTERGS